MAIFHLSVKTVGRSAGKSATAAAAYRACEKIECDREGMTHDYTRKRGLVHAEIIAPADAPKWAYDRSKLWNHAEASESRKNSTVAREFELALPAELTPDQRKELALNFARALVEEHGFVADVCIHDDHDENKNFHAHILCTTRKMESDGLTAKTRELDDQKSGKVDYWRATWANMVNIEMAWNGHAERVDHRSLEAQGIDREPQIHVGSVRANSTSPRKERNEAIKAAGRELGSVKDELKGYELEAQREQTRKSAQAAAALAEEQRRGSIREVLGDNTTHDPRPKQPEEEPALEVYLKTENAITILAKRNQGAAHEATQAEELAHQKAHQLKQQAESIKTAYTAMPKRPMLLGVKEWDAREAELREQSRKVVEAYKVAQNAVKAAKEVQIKAKAMLGRDFAAQQVLGRIREQRPDWADKYDQGKREHEAMQLQERQAKALQREGVRAGTNSNSERER
jgi:MobA/MobL family